MNASDPDLHHKLRRLEAVEVLLAQHERITRVALAVVAVLALLGLALIVNYIPACATVATKLLGFTP